MLRFLVTSILFFSLIAPVAAQYSKIQFVNNNVDQEHTSFTFQVNDVSSTTTVTLEYQEASEFIDIYGAAGERFISIYQGDDLSTPLVLDFVLTNDQPEKNHILVIDGIFDATNYPDGDGNFVQYSEGKLVSDEDNDSNTSTALLMHHGSMGHSTSLNIQGVSGNGVEANMASDLWFSEFSFYTTWEEELLSIVIEDGSTQYIFELNLEDTNLNNQACTIFTSGFIDPVVNNNGEPFGIWYTCADGGQGVEIPLTQILDLNDNILSDVRVSPNPFIDKIALTSAQDIDEWKVIDLKGRILMKGNLVRSSSQSLFLSTLPSGLYFLELTSKSNNTSITKRIIKR